MHLKAKDMFQYLLNKNLFFSAAALFPQHFVMKPGSQQLVFVACFAVKHHFALTDPEDY